MTNQIVAAFEDGVEKVGKAAGTDFAKSYQSLLKDTGDKLEQSAKTHLENDADSAEKLQGLLQDPAKDTPKLGGTNGAGGDTGGGSSKIDGALDPPHSTESAGKTGLGGGERGGGQATEGNGGCDGKGGDPVDVVSGQMITGTTDVELPGLLPLIVRRSYASGYRGGRLHGPGWSSTLDQRIEIDAEEIHYTGDDAQVLHYPRPNRPGQVVLPVDGARWPLVWDEASDTHRIEDPRTGLVRHFRPNQANSEIRLISALTDRNANSITYAHDHDGLPSVIHHSGGYHLGVDTTRINGAFRIEGLRLLDGSNDGNGSTLVEYRYDRRGRLTGIVDSSGSPYRYEYDDADRISSWVDRNNYRYDYLYGEDGRVLRGEGQHGYLSASFEYDLDNRSTTVTNSLGHATVYHYDEHHHLTKVVDPAGGAELTEFDRYHHLLSRTDPLGNSTRYTLSPDGDPIRIDRPDATAVTVVYDALRQPTEVLGPDGARWQYTYDQRGNLVRLTDPSGAATSYTYNGRGAMLSVTDAHGHTTTITVNEAGLPLSVTEASGATWTYARDARSRITAVTDPLGAVTTTEWTGADLPSQRIFPDGTSQAWQWDAHGDVLARTDRGGFTTTFELGPFHQVRARTDPDGTRHTFVHDTELRLASATNPQGLSWHYAYDPVGNLTGERDFNGRTVAHAYNAAGQLVQVTNGAGESVRLARDSLGRVIREDTSDGMANGFGYDAAGRLVYATGPDCEVTFHRDGLGRVLTETVNGRTITSTYDQLGQRTSRRTPTGCVSTWRYDPLGRPHTLTSGGARISFEHDAAGREISRRFGATIALTSSWDSLGQLTARRLVGLEGPDAHRAPMQERTWTYRDDGVPSVIADSFHGSRRLELDSIGRVTAVRAETWSEQYAYDATGNLNHAVDTGASQSEIGGPRSATGTLLRRAGRSHFDYDSQGRLVRTVRRTLSGAQRTWTYRYDPYDRLVEAVNPAGQRWRYRYDPLGRRIAKQRLGEDNVPVEEVRFTWDGEVLSEAEHIQAGMVTATSWDHEPGTWTPITQNRRTFYATAPQEVVDQQFHAMITDLVGTPTELVTAEGRIAWRQQAGLWGNQHGAAADGDTVCPLRFPGQYHDDETGLDYNHYRYYDPETGRYTSPDPLGLVAAPNHHGYVGNPLVWLDPLGLISDARYQKLDRPGYSNYTLSDNGGKTYYSGMFGPDSTAAGVQYRHSNNYNRFNPANGDSMNVVPGNRTYGESRLMEQRLAESNDTIIGRDGDNYRGNRQNPLAGNKLAEYQEYEQKKAGSACQ